MSQIFCRDSSDTSQQLWSIFLDHERSGASSAPLAAIFLRDLIGRRDVPPLAIGVAAYLAEEVDGEAFSQMIEDGGDARTLRRYLDGESVDGAGEVLATSFARYLAVEYGLRMVVDALAAAPDTGRSPENSWYREHFSRGRKGMIEQWLKWRSEQGSAWRLPNG